MSEKKVMDLYDWALKVYGDQIPDDIQKSMTEYLAYILEQQREDAGWVSVEDRLPELKKHFWDEQSECFKDEISTPVIVYDKIEELVYVLNYSEIRGFESNPDITHWQPLPSPPNNER